MTVNVETLEKLERRITLTLPADTISSEVESRLKRLARTFKTDGFRPGKVPMSVVAQRYGYSVQYEVVNDKVGQAFSAAASQAQLRVAGTPSITQKEQSPEGELAFEATFEVYPDVKIGDFASIEIDRVSAEVDEAAIDKTLDILRKQRRTFEQRAAAEGAEVGDRVTIDFEGKIDGEPFDGGKAEGFQFLIGEGQMLEQFDQAVRGMKGGESKTFPLQFPADYQGKEVAGKEADFMVTVKKIEAQHLPEVNEEFAAALGVEGGSVDALRADIKANLEREVKFRVQARNRAAVLEALTQAAELDLPKSLVSDEVERMVQAARANLKERGIKDADNAPIPAELFQDQAQKRVRVGLIAAELVRANGLQAKPEELQAHLDEVAKSYEKPSEVVRWYLADRQRMSEVEAAVVEGNIAEFVFARAKIVDKVVPFDELMQR